MSLRQVLVLLPLSVLLAGCSDPTGLLDKGTPTDAYCAALTADRQQISDMVSSGAPDALITNLPLLRSLSGQAPADVKTQWATFVSAIDGLRKALQDAGLKPSDFSNGVGPATLDPKKKDDIVAAASRLASADTTAATAAIEQEARDVCRVNLGM